MRYGVHVAVTLAVALLSAMSAGPAAAAFDYRTVPFAVGGEPTVLTMADAFLVGPPRGVWVGRRGALDLVRPRPDGAMEIVESVALPPHVVPIAVSEPAPWTFVLDAAGAVLVISRSFGKPDRLVATLPDRTAPVGHDRPEMQFLAVANAGSDDLSIYTWTDDERFSVQRVAVGSRPRALLIGQFIDAGEFGRPQKAQLAVANEGSGSVTILGTDAGLPVRGTFRVGGAPVSLASPALGVTASPTLRSATRPRRA